jgi:UDP-N-acetylglucosamine 2-epimerase
MLNRFQLQPPANLWVIAPCGYLDFLRLETAARKILTDSGGIQKEAYILQKPCLTLRRETEWVETVQVGWNRLLDPGEKDFAGIVAGFTPPSAAPDLFGQQVAVKMTGAIQKILQSPEGSR